MKKYKVEQSPFLDNKGNLKIHLQEVKNLEEDFVVVKRKYYQASDYSKIIIEPTLDLSSYIKLSNSTKDLLFYIIQILEYNIPTFKLKVSVVATLLKIKEPTVYKAIRELIDGRFIAKTDTKEIYWINHNKFFKGNFTFETYAQRKTNKNKPLT